MNSILIRAEDKNIWERRAPLVPSDVKEILHTTPTVLFVQESDHRFFPSSEYKKAGAHTCADLNPGDIILGIKEIPVTKILDGKVYLFFSHTIKGQKGNMPILKRILSGGSTLIDYEKITDEGGRRLVFFGRYAGDAGAIDILWLMGEYWHHHGITTPFLHCKQALHYSSVDEARKHLKAIGRLIRKDSLPSPLIPLVIGILGYGHVSQGAQQIFDCLPNKRIDPEKLPSLVEGGRWDDRTVYLSIFREEHLVANKHNKPFHLQEYYTHPERYASKFEQYLPYLTLVVNGIYWETRYPRFITWDALKKLYHQNRTPKLCGIADITCDINGSVECNVGATDSGMPAYLCDPITRTTTPTHKGEGIVLMAVDNLPAELPGDSSRFFSRQLKPFLSNLIQADFTVSLEECGLRPELKRATIVYQGKLTPPYEYLNRYL